LLRVAIGTLFVLFQWTQQDVISLRHIPTGLVCLNFPALLHCCLRVFVEPGDKPASPYVSKDVVSRTPGVQQHQYTFSSSFSSCHTARAALPPWTPITGRTCLSDCARMLVPSWLVFLLPIYMNLLRSKGFNRLSKPVFQQGCAGMSILSAAAERYRESAAKEMVEIVDESNRVLLPRTRKEMRSERLIHRATYAIVRTSGNFIYVQKRSRLKDYCPGFWGED
jgi:hypothetical protein